MWSQLQIKKGNHKINIFFSPQKHMLWVLISEVLLMSTCNIFFVEKYEKYYYFSTEKSIMKSSLYNFDPKPHFYIVKLGLIGVYITFLISAQKNRLLVLIRTTSSRQFLSTHNLCFEQKYEKYQFLSEKFHFLEVNFLYIWIGTFS